MTAVTQRPTRGRATPSPLTGAGAVLAALILVLAMALPVEAGTAPSTSTPTEDDDGLALLGRATEAARRMPYQGTQFISTWSRSGATTVLVEVEHLPDHGTILRILDTTAGPGSMMYESDAPQADVTLAGLPTLPGGTLGLLAEHYRVVAAGKGAVAGRSTWVVEARRGDGSVAARYWVDRTSGLMLRREVLDRRGRVVRASAFIDLRLDASLWVGHLPPTMPSPDGSRLSQGDLSSLRVHGWTAPAGFPCGLTLYDARRNTSPRGDVLHLSYSDGVSTMSLFVQKGTLDTSELDGWRETNLGGHTVYLRDTVPQRVVWAGHGQVYTLLADAPPEMVENVVATLPHDQKPDGFWGRMARGFARLGSWLNPFG